MGDIFSPRLGCWALAPFLGVTLLETTTSQHPVLPYFYRSSQNVCIKYEPNRKRKVADHHDDDDVGEELEE